MKYSQVSLEFQEGSLEARGEADGQRRTERRMGGRKVELAKEGA